MSGPFACLCRVVSAIRKVEEGVLVDLIKTLQTERSRENLMAGDPLDYIWEDRFSTPYTDRTTRSVHSNVCAIESAVRHRQSVEIMPVNLSRGLCFSCDMNLKT